MSCFDLNVTCEFCRRPFTITEVELNDEGTELNEDGDVDYEEGVHHPYYVYHHEEKCPHCGEMNEFDGNQRDLPDDIEFYDCP